MPNKVIDSVHALARRDRAANGINFGWRDSTPILDDEDDNNDISDPDYNPDHYNSEDDNDSDSEDDGDDYSGASDPQPIAGLEHNNNNKINKEDDADSEPNDEDREDDVENQPTGNNE